MQALATAQAADGASSAVTVTDSTACFVAWGTWGGGTFTIQVSPDSGTTWVATSVTFSANGYATLQVPNGAQVRGNLAGATTPSLNLSVGFIEND